MSLPGYLHKKFKNYKHKRSQTIITIIRNNFWVRIYLQTYSVASDCGKKFTEKWNLNRARHASRASAPATTERDKASAEKVTKTAADRLIDHVSLHELG